MKEKITAAGALDAAIILSEYLKQQDNAQDIDNILTELFILNGYPE